MRRDTLGGCTYDLGVYNTSLILRTLAEEPTEIRAIASFSEEKIDKLKKQALRLLPEKIRKETDWQAKGLVLRNVDIYVLVDGMNDKSAEEKVALELEI